MSVSWGLLWSRWIAYGSSYFLYYSCISLSIPFFFFFDMLFSHTLYLWLSFILPHHTLFLSPLFLSPVYLNIASQIVSVLLEIFSQQNFYHKSIAEGNLGLGNFTASVISHSFLIRHSMNCLWLLIFNFPLTLRIVRNSFKWMHSLKILSQFFIHL